MRDSGVAGSGGGVAMESQQTERDGELEERREERRDEGREERRDEGREM